MMRPFYLSSPFPGMVGVWLRIKVNGSYVDRLVLTLTVNVNASHLIQIV